MGDNLLPDPGSCGDQFACGSSLDQLQILLNGAMGICINVHAGQVAVHQWDQPREDTLLVCKQISNFIGQQIYFTYFAIDDFAEGHEHVLIIGRAACWRLAATWRITCSDILAEPEFLVQRCSPFLGTLHVLINLNSRILKLIRRL